VDTIGHRTTRLIGHRPPIDADLDVIVAAAARTGTAREINSFPDRLNLDSWFAGSGAQVSGSQSPLTRTPSRTSTTSGAEWRRCSEARPRLPT
jgi:hypothetical protein